MNRDEAMAWIEKLADRYRRRKKADPEWYQSYIKIIGMLSKEIYSQTSHFVYELIQNAEDNRYHPRCSDRFVEFTIDEKRIVVRNNEVGFSAEDVKALCSVAESPKVDKTLGYIGEKGIGFKSVFKVSSGPQIHSNGFHFAFDKEMIVPRWCEPPEDVPVDSAMTTIILPLRDSIRNDPEQALQREFVGLPGETLLFLSKLNRIRIHDRSGVVCRELTRRDARDGLVIIDDGASSRRWWVHRRRIDVPPWLSEDKRKDVRHRELILGFMTDARGSCLRPESAPVFAFLPTNLKPGMPFLIQGDFLTAANRESIHEGAAEGAAWNRWLRDELAPTYLEALREGVAKSKAFRLSFLETLPLPHEVDSRFFQPVAKRIREGIAGERLFPGESGRLRTMDEVFHGDATLRRLFPSDSLAVRLGRDVEYLDPRFTIPDAVGEYLQIADISEKLSSLLSNQGWIEQQSDDWFIDLYGYLNDHPELVDDDKLQALPIVRLEGGRLAKAEEDTIYLPPSEERVEDSYGLKRFGFRIVSHAIVRRIPSPRTEEERRLNQRTQAARAFLLDHLEVKHHRPLEIVWNEILPHFEDKAYESADELEDDFGLVLYVKEHWGQIQKDVDDDEANYSLADIKSALGRLPIPVIGVRKKREVRTVSGVYLPPDLEGDGMLFRLFQSVPDIWFVDADLLAEWDTTRKRKERKFKEWQAFLADIGAERGLRLSRIPLILPCERDIRRPGNLEPYDTITQVKNYAEIPDLDKVFNYLEKVPSRRNEKGRLLLRLLDHEWGRWESLYATSSPSASYWWQSVYYYRRGGKGKWTYHQKPLPAPFLQILHGEAWVPVRGEGPPRRPEEVWVSDNDQGLGFAEGHRLAVAVENQDLVRALGFRTHLTIGELLRELDNCIDQNNRDLNDYRKLYSLLNKVMAQDHCEDSLIEEFRTKRLIYLPQRPPEHAFAASDEVVWSTDTHRFTQGFPSLERAYPSLRDFFLQVGVAERATPQLALETLSQFPRFYETQDDEPGRDSERCRLWETYQALVASNFARDGGTAELQEFLERGTLLAEDFKFYLCSALIAPDDAGLAGLFKEQGVGPFLWLPQANAEVARIAGQLADRLGMKRVSAARRRVSSIPLAEEGDESQNIRSRFDETRRFLLGFIRKNATARYEALQSGGQATALACAPIRVCKAVNVTYEFDGQRITDPREHTLSVDPTGIYLRADRFDLLELGSDLQAALGVDGLAEGFFTLVSLPADLRQQHAQRQGYVVPEQEWQDLVPPEPPESPPEPAGPRTSHEAVATNGRAEGGHATSEEVTPGRPGAQPPPEPPLGRPCGPRTSPGDAGRPIGSSGPSREGDEPRQAQPKHQPPNRTGGNGTSRPELPGRVWTPRHEGEPYDGPTRFRAPRGSNARLRHRLGRTPQRREAQEYLQGPPADRVPVSADVSDEPLPTRITTTLYAVNLEYGFLRFAPDHFRIFEPGCPERIELVGDDDQDRIDVAVDYKKGILHKGVLHGNELTEFLELQAWPYETILFLEATSTPGRFHLHAQALEKSRSIGKVNYFDIDENGVPITKESDPEPFTVLVDENIYCQERRWENRHAYDALVARKGEGVWTAVFEVLEKSREPLSAAAIHRHLMANDRPCSYFSILAVLYGYQCFERTNDHRWKLTATKSTDLREGYRLLLEGAREPSKPPDGQPEPPGKGLEKPTPPLTDQELSRLTNDLRDLTCPESERWLDAIDRLLRALEQIKRRLEVKSIKA
jgi:hypothetical protein